MEAGHVGPSWRVLVSSAVARRAIAGTFVIALALACATACGREGPPSISGTVYQSNGYPCANCPIIITSPDHPMPEILQITDLSGAYKRMVPGKGIFVVESPIGDQVARREVTVTSDRHDVDVHFDSEL